VLLDNTEQIYFGIQSYETAERVSKMLGTATNVLESANESESRSWQRSGGNPQGDGVTVNRSYGKNWSEHGRELLRPEEVLTLHGDYLLAFLRGLPPILARRVKFFEDSEFKATRATRRVIGGLVWWVLFTSAAGLIVGSIFKWW
jgi:type IV secretion system protein VirD4